jgi:hypothetical protein
LFLKDMSLILPGITKTHLIIDGQTHNICGQVVNLFGHGCVIFDSLFPIVCIWTRKPAFRPHDGLHQNLERQQSAGRAVTADGGVRNLIIILRIFVSFLKFAGHLSKEKI